MIYVLPPQASQKTLDDLCLLHKTGRQPARNYFPAGETHFVLPKSMAEQIPFWPVVDVLMLYENDEDIFALGLAINAVREISSTAFINVVIPYLPHARQDRVTQVGGTNALSVLVDVLDAYGVDSVMTYDVHSDAFQRMITMREIRFINRTRLNLIQDLEGKNEDFKDLIYDDKCVLVCPDAGAVRATDEIATHYNLPVLYFEKKRDPNTGKILDMQMLNPSLLSAMYNDAPLLIADDICDGGATFVSIAEKIHEVNPELSVNLYVTHGIFSKGTRALTGIDSVFSYINIWPSK